MAKSKETFNKREKEKQRIKQRQEKREKMEQRKAAGGPKSLDDMMAYIDEDGNLSSTPPDPKKRREFKAEDMQISVPKYEPGDEADSRRTGKVSFFNESKGFGFIIDALTGERIFVHINALKEAVGENDKVTFLVEQGPRGLNATEVERLK